ncbi:aspartate beta-hydroxylase domain-containing protein 2-like [Antedon mediterranea]|uniref:aspartate beta-hydroxylase domain-containing protein 2-like n=1 Tax=Antedon mediterranea TaxID=105859 RepID=UPI003AF8004B
MVETWNDALTLFLTLCACCLIPILLRKAFKKNNQSVDSKNDDLYSKCTSPNCVRCQNYRILDHQLTDKFIEISQIVHGDLSRIEQAIGTNERSNRNQQPNVFFLPKLDPIKPFYAADDTDLAPDAQLIANNFLDIYEEFLEVFNALQDGNVSGWLSNSVPTGNWYVFHLYNQGVKVPQNCTRCPRITKILENGLRKFIKENAFGNAAFSVLEPGTHITEHFGPCNVRIRCHLGILTPPNCYLKVDGIKEQWRQGQCLLFDDSFCHEAKHCGSDEPRAVFMVDLWHPDVTKPEMSCLNILFGLPKDE